MVDKFQACTRKVVTSEKCLKCPIAAGCGECFQAGTLISTPNGKVNIEDAYYEASKGQTSTIQIIDSITIETDAETDQITGIKTHTKQLKFTQGGLIEVKDIGGETTVNE